MEHESPIMKAWREFALADPEDCDREWAAYLALVSCKEIASKFPPTNSTSPLHNRVHNPAEVWASSTTRSTAPLHAPSNDMSSTSVSEESASRWNQDDVYPPLAELRRALMTDAEWAVMSEWEKDLWEMKHLPEEERMKSIEGIVMWLPAAQQEQRRKELLEEVLRFGEPAPTLDSSTTSTSTTSGISTVLQAPTELDGVPVAAITMGSVSACAVTSTHAPTAVALDSTPASVPTHETDPCSMMPTTCLTICSGSDANPTRTSSYQAAVPASSASPHHHLMVDVDNTTIELTWETTDICSIGCPDGTADSVESNNTNTMLSTLGNFNFTNDLLPESDSVCSDFEGYSVIVPVPSVLRGIPVQASANADDDTPQDGQNVIGTEVFTVSNFSTLKQVKVQPSGTRDVLSILMRSSSSLIIVGVCPSSTEKMQHSVMLETLKPSLSLELHLLVLVVMRKEAVVWPAFQSARCNTILVLPWDPGVLMNGMCANFHGFLPTCCFYQGTQLNCNFGHYLQVYKDLYLDRDENPGFYYWLEQLLFGHDCSRDALFGCLRTETCLKHIGPIPGVQNQELITTATLLEKMQLMRITVLWQVESKWKFKERIEVVKVQLLWPPSVKVSVTAISLGAASELRYLNEGNSVDEPKPPCSHLALLISTSEFGSNMQTISFQIIGNTFQQNLNSITVWYMLCARASFYSTFRNAMQLLGEDTCSQNWKNNINLHFPAVFLLQDWRSCFMEHIIQCGCDLLQWKIAWSLTWEFLEIAGSTSKDLLLLHPTNNDVNFWDYPLPSMGRVQLICDCTFPMVYLLLGDRGINVGSQTLQLPWHPGDCFASALCQDNFGREDGCFCPHTDTSQVPWDPGGLSGDRLGGKPNFKGGGLSATCLHKSCPMGRHLGPWPAGSRTQRRPRGYIPKVRPQRTWLGTELMASAGRRG